MAKHRLAAMSWREVRAARARQPVVLMPLGSTEPHGPVSPFGERFEQMDVRPVARPQ